MSRFRLFADPTFVFVVVGVLSFAAHRWVIGAQQRPASANTLTVELAEQRAVVDNLERRLGRAPTEVERAAALDAYVADELLAREATRLGLHERDPVIRRRLIQKLEFALESMAGRSGTVDESAAQLAAPAATGADAAAAIAVSIEHRFFRDGDRAAAAANRLRASRTDGQGALSGSQQEVVGDAFPLGAKLSYASLERLEKALGVAIREKVAVLEPLRWSEPIASPYGFHVVRVIERGPMGGTEPRAFDEAYARTAAANERARAAYVERLRRTTKIVVEETGKP